MGLLRIDISEHSIEQNAYSVAGAYGRAAEGYVLNTHKHSLATERDNNLLGAKLGGYVFVICLLAAALFYYGAERELASVVLALGFAGICLALCLYNMFWAWRLKRELTRVEERPRTAYEEATLRNDFQKACHRVWLARHDVTSAALCWNAYADRAEAGLVKRFADDDIVYHDIMSRLHHVRKMASITYQLYADNEGCLKRNAENTDLNAARDRLNFRLIDEMKSWYQTLKTNYGKAGFAMA